MWVAETKDNTKWGFMLPPFVAEIDVKKMTRLGFMLPRLFDVPRPR